MITVSSWEEIEHQFPGTKVLDITPAGYDQFETYASGDSGMIRVDVISDVPLPDEIAVPKRQHYLTTVQFAFDAGERCFGLLPGGFLPPELLLAGTGVLIDRNIAIGLSRPGVPRNAASRAADLSWLNSEWFKVSPVVAAFEGRQPREQSRAEFFDELQKIADRIEQRLPRAYRFDFGEPAASSVYELYKDSAKRLSREQDFLKEVCLRLRLPSQLTDPGDGEAWLLQLARDHGLKILTAVVWIALAVLYESDDVQHARGMLKLGDKWLPSATWKKHAYNAIADVRLIELLSVAASYPHRFAGLTKDKSLAHTWCGLRPTSNQDAQATWLRCEPAAQMFPRLDGSPEDLRQRMIRFAEAHGG